MLIPNRKLQFNHSPVRSNKQTNTGKTLRFCLIVSSCLFSLQLGQLGAAEQQLTKPTANQPAPTITPNPANSSSNSEQSRLKPSLNSKARLGVPEMLLGMGASLNSGNYSMSLVYIHDGQIDSLRLSHLSNESNQFDMLEHLQGPKRMVVSQNGKTWLYTGNERLLISKEDESPVVRWRRQLARLSRNISNYNVVVSGLSRVAGRIAYQLNFIAKDDSRNSTRLWIDTQYLLPLKIESLNSERRVIEQLLTVDITYPANLTEADFDVGAGYINQVDLETSFSHKQPLDSYQGKWSINWLPAGFELSLRKLKTSELVNYEHWIYSDGLSTLSIFLEQDENHRKNHNSTFVSGDELIFDLSANDKRITVVGNIPLKVAQKIAKSVILNAPVIPIEVESSTQ